MAMEEIVPAFLDEKTDMPDRGGIRMSLVGFSRDSLCFSVLCGCGTASEGFCYLIFRLDLFGQQMFG